MAHVPDENAILSLQKDVTLFTETLRTLTKAKASHLVGKTQRLPVEEVELAAGLVFLHTTKAGFIVSGVTGHGLLLKKVELSAKPELRLLHRVCSARGPEFKKSQFIKADPCRWAKM